MHHPWPTGAAPRGRWMFAATGEQRFVCVYLYFYVLHYEVMLLASLGAYMCLCKTLRFAKGSTVKTVPQT